MKILKPILLLVILVSFVSCNNDDDNNDYLLNNENLAGTYNVTMLNSREVQTTDVNGVDIITTTTTSGNTFQLEIVFFDNGNYVVDGLYVEEYRMDVQGEVLEEDTEIIDIDFSEGTYATNNTSMELVMDGDTYEVTLFNQNELRVTLEDIWVENGDDFVYTEEIRMVRQ